MSHFDEHDRRKYEAEVIALLESIRSHVGATDVTTKQILQLLKQKPHLTKARIVIMPKQIQVGQTAQAVIQGFDQNGNPFPLDSSYGVTYSASNPADVSFSSPVNPDGSDTITGLAVDAGVAIGATITRPDGAVVSATADTLTIVAPPPVLTTATVVLQ
jgi:hypothetical protein